MTTRILPRSDAWRVQYQEQRYGRHLSPLELEQRLRDLMINILLVSPEGKVGIRQMQIGDGVVSNKTTVWQEKWTHMLEEMRLRHGPYPNGFDREIFKKEPFPNYASELAKKAAKRLASIGSDASEMFIRFGKREHMQRLREAGALRLQPARFFAASHHNEAIRDNELAFSVSLALSREDLMAVVENPQDVPSDIPEHRFDMHLQWPSDYWVYCLGSSMEARLFVDYNADSCVLIRDRSRFSQLLRQAAAQKVKEADMQYGPVEYAD